MPFKDEKAMIFFFLLFWPSLGMVGFLAFFVEGFFLIRNRRARVRFLQSLLNFVNFFDKRCSMIFLLTIFLLSFVWNNGKYFLFSRGWFSYGRVFVF